MTKADVTKFIKDTGTFMSKHTPELLTGFGIAGMITTTILAVKATPKALALIEKEKERQWVDELRPVDVVKTTWKCYLPATILGAASVGCLVGSSAVSLKRNAVLATAYKLSETALTEYKDKVVETIGEKKEKLVREAVAEDKVKQTPVKNNEVIVTGKGKTLCLEPTSMRHFESDAETIRRAVNELNRRMRDEMYISLNEFYYELGLEGTDLGDMMGWNINIAYIDVTFTSALTPNDEPCLALVYNTAPIYDFMHA
jgi:hypothetical protein